MENGPHSEEACDPRQWTILTARALTLTQLKLDLPEGVWQVLWFGSLERFPASAASLGIHTFFRLTSGTAARPAGDIEQVLVSLAHMHLLPIGRLVQGQDGSLLHLEPTSRQRRRVLRADLRRENTEILTRAALLYEGPAQHLVGDPRYDGLLVRAKRTDTTPEVLIPCSSLFQFYWGVTSTLSEAVMSGKLEDLERWFYKPERTELASDGTFTLEIRRQWGSEIARYLATILADPEAIEAGRTILRRLVATQQLAAPSEPLRLEVWPPFPRPTQIDGYFFAVEGEDASGNAPVCLTHIFSASLSPNWQRLLCYLENDNRHTPPAGGDDGPVDLGTDDGTSPSVAFRTLAAADIVLTETPGGYGLNGAELPILAIVDERFPDLKNYPIEMAPKEAASRSEPRSRLRVNHGPRSAIPGSPGIDKHVLQGKLVGGVNAIPSSPLESDLELDVEPVDEQLSEFAKSFLNFPIDAKVADRMISVEVSFLNPYEDSPELGHPVYFGLPRMIDGEVIAWLYRDPDRNFTKRGICVCLVATAAFGLRQVRYVIDLERRVPKRRLESKSCEPIKNGFLVAWLDKPVAAGDVNRTLRILIDAVAKNRSPSLRCRPAAGICTATLRHSESSPSRLVSRIMTAVDQCSDEVGAAEPGKAPTSSKC